MQVLFVRFSRAAALAPWGKLRICLAERESVRLLYFNITIHPSASADRDKIKNLGETKQAFCGVGAIGRAIVECYNKSTNGTGNRGL